MLWRQSWSVNQDEPVSLQEFAAEHSAGLEEYTAALKTECEPVLVNGEPSASQYTRTASGSSVFSRLLNFEQIADELAAAGAEAEGGQRRHPVPGDD